MFCDNKVKNNYNHKVDIDNILYTLEQHIINHPIVKYNNILYKTVNILINSIKN